VEELDLEELDSCIVTLAGFLCKEMFENDADDDFGSPVFIFESDAYPNIADPVIKKISIIAIVVKKRPPFNSRSFYSPLVISALLLHCNRMRLWYKV
jgi:hypothetical protein